METKVTKRLLAILGNYQTFRIDSRTSGWPDHLVQLTNSRVVLVESKEIETNKDGSFLLDEFRADQAAWMYKWQRYNGLCFLFLGFKKSSSIGVINCNNHIDWLNVRKHKWRPVDLRLFTDSDNKFLEWFEMYTK